MIKFGAFAFLASALLMLVFLANLLLGMRDGPLLDNAQEMLVLFASVTFFAIATLIRENRQG